MEDIPVQDAVHPLPDRDTAFIGHPKGLAFLSFSEAWERFSYYGMQALLVLYMVHQLLLPGHVEHIAGFEGFRRLISAVYGGGKEMSVQATASAIFGLYAGLVYLTPIGGGILADRVLGKRRTVILGASLMALGHFLMAFDVSFLLALLCLVLGTGCFKGNIASQVGSLYGPGDLRAPDAFQIFYLGINAGVIAAPLICGTLGEKVGWHYGFAAAGVGMLIGLAIYLAGQKHFPPDPVLKRGGHTARPKLRPGEGKTMVLLICLIPVLAIGVVGNQEIFNAYMVWAGDHAALTFFGQVMPTTWLVTVDAIVSVSFLVIMVGFWRVWALKFKEPDEISKIAIGTVISVFAMLSLAAGAAISAATGAKVAVGWLLAFHVINSIGFANVLPVSLALYSRVAPPAVGATIVGVYYLHLFAANNLVGWLGGLLEKMPATQFWLLHAGLIAASAVILILVKVFFSRLLEPQPAEVAA